MITKESLEQAKTQFNGMLVNSELSVIAYKATLKAFDEELSKMPEEKKVEDPMPQEAKELIEAAK